MPEVIDTIVPIVSIWYGVAILILLRGFFSIQPGKKKYGHKFSIVIAARNEERSIDVCLQSVFRQTLSRDRYEVIIVDDRSSDATAAIIKKYEQQFANCTLCSVSSTPEGISPKKYAVSQGVMLASNEIIVFTDADCIVPEQWLETIDTYFSPDVGLVQGITTYHKVDGINRLFFGLQAIDFASHSIVAAAAIGARLPINSNANNFAFRKAAFKDVGGVLKKIGHVVSGDDDLLLQKIWRQKKWAIRFMLDRAGAVTTMPTPTVAGVFQQRARWGSKTVHYNSLQVLLLSGIFLFYCTGFLLLFLIPWYNEMVTDLGRIIVLKFLGEIVLMVPGLIAYGQKSLLPYLPIASLLQLPMVVVAVFAGVFGRFQWKGQTFSRTVK